MRVAGAAAALSLLALAPAGEARSPEGPLPQPMLFTVDLPTGFEVASRAPGPDFQVFDIGKGGVAHVSIYQGCCASFPLKQGVKVSRRGANLKVAMRGRRAVEYLWSGRGQIHVWVQEGADIDTKAADRIAASVKPQ